MIASRRCATCGGHLPVDQASGAHVAPDKSVCFGPIDRQIVLRLPDTPEMMSLLRDLAILAVEDEANAVDATAGRVDACEAFDRAVTAALEV